MNVWLTGGSGLVGTELLKLLLNEPKVKKVVSFGRKKLPFDHAKLEQAELDWKTEHGPDVAFCCLGTTIKKAGSQDDFRKVDHDLVLDFAQVAKERGASKFVVVSAMGAKASSAIFYNRVKGEMEQDLMKVGFDSLVIHRPSLLLGDRAEKRFGESLAIKLYPIYRPLLKGPLAKQQPIAASAVARSMLKKGLSATSHVLVMRNEDMLAFQS
jgi:uncharacterized protein YbjT (DUF2867 family)